MCFSFTGIIVFDGPLWFPFFLWMYSKGISQGSMEELLSQGFDRQFGGERSTSQVVGTQRDIQLKSCFNLMLLSIGLKSNIYIYMCHYVCLQYIEMLYWMRIAHKMGLAKTHSMLLEVPLCQGKTQWAPCPQPMITSQSGDRVKVTLIDILSSFTVAPTRIERHHLLLSL